MGVELVCAWPPRPSRTQGVPHEVAGHNLSTNLTSENVTSVCTVWRAPHTPARGFCTDLDLVVVAPRRDSVFVDVGCRRNTTRAADLSLAYHLLSELANDRC